MKDPDIEKQIYTNSSRGIILILLDNYNYKGSLTWRNEWIISKYESPWGVLQKFKYANSANHKDIFYLLGSEKARLRSSWPKSDCNLITLNGLDSNSLKSILGSDIKSINEKNINEIIGIFFDANRHIKSFVKNTLYYCPECIKIGFHSVFHQFSFLDKCAYHKNVLLESECPNCGHESIYNILSETQEPYPFACKCGHSFIGENSYLDFINSWIQAKNLTIDLNEIKSLLKINENQKNIIRRTYFYIEHLKINPVNFLKCILSINDYSYFHNNSRYSGIISDTPKIPCKDASSETGEEYYNIFKGTFRSDIFQTLKESYKSIIKHLEKTIFKTHQSCIKSYKQKLIYGEENNFPHCPYALIYILLRSNFEGRFNFYKNYKTEYSQFINLNNHRFPRIEKGILRDIYKRWGEYFNEQNIGVKSFIWVINKVFIQLVYNYLYSLFEAIKTKNTFNYHNIFKKSLFLIELPKNGGSIFKIHFWNPWEAKISYYEKSLECPYKSIKKRRENQQRDKTFSINTYNDSEKYRFSDFFI